MQSLKFRIRPWKHEDSTSAINGIREIFFASSTQKHFSSDVERERFFNRWAALYWQHHPDWVWLAESLDGIAGYLVGCPDSQKASPILGQGSLDKFSDLWTRYPAHLHMNVHPLFRNRGVGKALLDAFLTACSQRQICGAHIITDPTARNVVFYKRNGFTEEIRRTLHGHDLLFLGIHFA